MLKNLNYFYYSYVLPEIRSKTLHATLQQSEDLSDTEPMDVDYQAGYTYFCPSCSMVIPNVVTELKHRSICCDLCNLWYHFHCVGVTNTNVKCMSSWHCGKCVNSSRI